MRVVRMEGLEDRRMMSVTGLSLLGPLPTGGTKTEETLEAGKVISTTTEKVIGPVKFRKVECTEVQSVTKEGKTTTTILSYYNHDKSGNIIVLGRTVTEKTGSVTDKTTVALSPDEILFPVSMVFGTTYKFAWTHDDTTIVTPGGTKVVKNESIKFTVKLHSASEVSISVPIGKVKAYLLDETVATTIGKTTTTESVEVWAVPGDGVAKTVVGTGKTAQTTEVTGLKA